jgi:hypothetical protein
MVRRERMSARAAKIETLILYGVAFAITLFIGLALYIWYGRFWEP